MRSKFFLLLILCLVFVGCNGKLNLTGGEDICAKPEAEGSVLCEYLPVDPKTADLLLVMANVELLKHEKVKVEQVEAFFAEVEKYLEAEVTWKDFMLKVAQKVEWVNKNVGLEVMILTSYMEIPGLNQPLPINAYDKYLIKKHLENQRSKVLPWFKK